jgi:hypothetical protein
MMDPARKRMDAPAELPAQRRFELPRVGNREGRARGMVRWYDPRQLFRTGPEVGLSLALGARTDQRVLDSIAATQPLFDCGSHGDELWLDYVADLGDGFDPTFAVARTIAQGQLTVAGAPQPLRRGQVLIMGGDQIYPTPSRLGYLDRLRLPYEAAFHRAGDPDKRRVPLDGDRASLELDREAPYLLALPGNHDWYDNLTSFGRLFCQQRALGTLQTVQSRSYFALALPHRWWLLAVDIQLGTDIDRPQLDYFQRRAIDHMEPGDRVILMVAKPDWNPQRKHSADLRNNLRYLEDKIGDREAEVALWVAGDLHYYQRYEHRPEGATAEQAWHKITCGGGGAFTHPTHVEPTEVSVDANGRPDCTFREQRCYPDRQASRRLCRKVLRFPVSNPEFGLISGVLYGFLGWMLMDAAWGPGSPPPLGTALADMLAAMVRRPAALSLAILVVVGTYLQAARRPIAGPLHGVAHVAAAMLLTRTAVWGLDLTWAGLWDHRVLRVVLPLAVITLTGALIGGVIMGGFLFISVRFKNILGNDAFSSARLTGYKSFLRLRVHRDGLTVHVIGLPRVPATGLHRQRDPDRRRDALEALAARPISGAVEIDRIELSAPAYTPPARKA